MFWLIGTAFALRNFLTLTTLGGFTRVFGENCGLLVFGGLGDLEKLRGTIWGPKRAKNAKKWIFPGLGETPADRMGFRQKRSVFPPRFRPLVPPIGAVPTEKTQPLSGQKKLGPAKNLKTCRQFYFYCGFKKVVSSKTERFWPLVPPIEAVRTEKTKPYSGLWGGGRF